jgi:hypothetical protein
MNLLIIFGVAAGCILAERLWPAMELPRVNAWWGRVILINSIQLGITLLAGQTWNRWLDHASIFCLRDTSAIGRPPRLSISFRRSLIIGGIGTGMNQPFYGECCTKSTIQPVAWKSLPAFTNIRSRF